ncbi:unnamed protein product [Spodoptera exigua]|nr:unnamed protein product [Spodoptera exigua]
MLRKKRDIIKNVLSAFFNCNNDSYRLKHRSRTCSRGIYRRNYKRWSCTHANSLVCTEPQSPSLLNLHLFCCERYHKPSASRQWKTLRHMKPKSSQKRQTIRASF